jgi:topoisomerase IV subunit B
VTLYARDDAHREELLRSALSGRGKVEVSRFKGLGEMPARYLRATTMDPEQRTLLRVTLPPKADPAAIEPPADELARTRALVETLMGRRPELRFEYIQKNARFARDLDV